MSFIGEIAHYHFKLPRDLNHDDEGATHFCAWLWQVLIACQCQSLHKDTGREMHVTGSYVERGSLLSLGKLREYRNNPFCTLPNNYCNMKIITVEAQKLCHDGVTFRNVI